MTVRDHFKTHRLHLIITALAVAALIVAVLWTAIAVMRPMPPRNVMMVTGPEGSSFFEFGKLYRELLACNGIDLQLLPTAGALENLSLLNDPRSNAVIGFLQGGSLSRKKSPGLESLGTVSYEPLWFFYRGASPGRGLAGLRGRKISIGPEGSGSREVALRLLALNGIDERFAELLALTPQDAADKLLRNELDAVLMFTSWESPLVRRLIADRNIELLSFPRADAYVALYPFLNKLTVPEGVGDLAGDRPPRDAVLIAPKASLVVREGLHPAIKYLLLDAAEKIHAVPGIFHKAGQFPAAEAIDLPLSDEARQFHKSGRPFLQRHLPFWLAVLVDRLLVLLIPVLGVMYPLLRFMPSLFEWQRRRRIHRLYGELMFLERDLESRGAGQSIGELISRLDRIEEKANHLRVHEFYANMLYTLRMHITLVRERMERTRAKGK